MKAKQPDTLILLDMHAILHRGFHALQDFTTTDGRPTGALFGLYTMLLSLIKEISPTYIAACYDLPEPTKRHEVFADYKAGRKETDPALVAQIIESRQVLDAFGIRHFEQSGFEADDLLGTIVSKIDDKLNKNEIRIIIASGDHDTLQLVNDKKVQVYTMRRGIKDTILYDEEAVKGRYGFRPSLLPDYKGLRGDPSDNIPGIAGIGEKTATTLIQLCGDLESILETAANNPDKLAQNKIRPGIIKKLQDDAVSAKFSKELALIRTDATVVIEVKNLNWRENINRDELLALTDKLQFRSLKSRIAEVMNWEDQSVVDKQKTGSLFATGEKLDPKGSKELDQCLLMVWLLNSDITSPTVNDIESLTNTADLNTAHKTLMSLLREADLYQLYDEIERPLMPVISRMNQRGICLDVDYLNELKRNYSSELADIESQIWQLAGTEFNISSPKQLGEVLFDELNLPKKGIKKTSTGNMSTAESELEKLRDQHEIIPLILAHRELSKLINTYIAALPKLVDKDGRLRANFIQWGTTTGRMSSRSPNLQNIPIRSELGAPIRRAFVADQGKLLAAIDYSQIELRIAAWLSGDQSLREVFVTGSDIHSAVASDMFGVPASEVTKDMRSAAKTINYGILYGMGANALRANLNQGEGEEVTKSQASAYLDRYFDAFPDLEKYQESIKRSVKKNGYTTTYFGRRRYFSTIKSKLPYLRAQAERMAINAPIQGTQADIIKLAMVKVSDWLDKNNLRDRVGLLLQVHDELVFEINSDDVAEIVPQLVNIMQEAVSTGETDGVVMIADARVGPNWGELQDFNDYEKNQ